MRTTTAINDTLTAAEVRPPATRVNVIDDSFERVTGAEAVPGNRIDLLIDAAENYPAWLDAIAGARNRIYFESYIIHQDDQGARFAEALIAKAKEGVDVKLVYDWVGGFGKTSWLFWRKLRRAGVDVRCYNPPNMLDPLGFFSRDHRKSLVVDGNIAFVSGLCVGHDWVGYEDRGVAPWRDTGVAIRGPAVADVEAAFAAVWAACGTPLEQERIARPDEIDAAGDKCLRIVQSIPSAAHIYRLDLLLAAFARERMWLTDAYFIGTPSFLEALKAAARDGVDVRVLLPQTSDIGLIRDTTRSTYRPLLEAGVRLFEWNGPMLHAKTAVFDGKISRVGSTNMNIASWFGNYELDVIIEDAEFGELMELTYRRDLENSTEVVLSDTERARRPRQKQLRRSRKGSGSVKKTTAGAINAAASISSAITKKTPLGPAEARLLIMLGTVLVGLAMLFIKYPRGASIPLVGILLLVGIPTLVRALQSFNSDK